MRSPNTRHYRSPESVEHGLLSAWMFVVAAVLLRVAIAWIAIALAFPLARAHEKLARRRNVHHVAIGATTIDEAWTWTHAVGDADAAGTPMEPDTPWFIASVTKLHIAAVILRLHEQAHLDLDAPITSYLPDRLRARLHVHDGVDHTAELTPVHLLGHLSGLSDYLDEPPPGGQSLIDEITETGDRAWTPEDAVARACDQLSPHFPPSDPNQRQPRIRYSDTSYQLLVAIAQHVTGRPMTELYRELLFEPLGLKQAGCPATSPSNPPPNPPRCGSGPGRSTTARWLWPPSATSTAPPTTSCASDAPSSPAPC